MSLNFEHSIKANSVDSDQNCPPGLVCTVGHAILSGNLVYGVLRKLPYILFGLHHAKNCLRAYVDSEGPDQTARPHSLIRAFTIR